MTTYRGASYYSGTSSGTGDSSYFPCRYYDAEPMTWPAFTPIAVEPQDEVLAKAEAEVELSE